MEIVTLLLLSLAVLLYALVSKRAIGTLISAPLAFTAFGLLLGEAGIGLIDLSVSGAALNTLAEVTLVLALFAGASSINITRLRRHHALPLRLLGIGLPLTIISGLVLALIILPDLSLIEATLLAIVLSPTDAALGQEVVTNQAVPEPVRRTLNVESGLNDGLVFPVLLIVASLGTVENNVEHVFSFWGWVALIFKQLVFGPITGLVIGWVGSRLTNRAYSRNAMSPAFLRLSTVALPMAAYAAAEIMGGNGFLSAFVCGLTVGANSERLREGTRDFAEAEGELLSLLVFFALGAVLLPAVVSTMQWSHLLYAVFSLTIIRMAPVALSLTRQGLDWPTLGFIGWFGPRGLASIIYLLILTQEYTIGNLELISAVVLLTVSLSIVVHGVTATPFSRLYAGRFTESKSRETEG